MQNSKSIAVIAVFAVAACGGSGGGSGAGTSSLGETARNGHYQLPASAYDYNSFTSELDASYNFGNDRIRMQIDLDERPSDSTIYFNGDEVEGSAFGAAIASDLGFGYTNFTDDQGNIYAFSNFYAESGWLRPVSGNWSSDDVNYVYSVTTTGGETFDVVGSNGTLSANVITGQYTLYLGGVSLSGTINAATGQTSGTASYQGASGNFSGLDYNGQALLGAFSGGNHENLVFGGGYYEE